MGFIPIGIAALITLFGWLVFDGAKKRAAGNKEGQPAGKPALRMKIGMILLVVGLWLLIGFAIALIFGDPAQKAFTVSIFPPRVDFVLWGYRPSETIVVGWGVMAVVITAAVILRIFFIPKLTDIPGKFQNVVELLIETVESYTTGQNVRLGRPMFGFIFTIGVTLLGNVLAELMGFRSPSSDLMFTVAISLSVFIMANWYGLRKLSVRGRLKNLASPSAVLLPIRLITDVVNPFSMACRLFGNTISGMIVMNLIYLALGNFAAGIPSVVGLYFNVFSALIQMIIFITLSLASIHDATAEAAA